MATAYHNLSSYDADTMPDASGMKVAIAAAEWNAEITDALLKGAVDTLLRNGVKEENIYVARVPGTVELTFASQQMAEFYQPDAVITDDESHERKGKSGNGQQNAPGNAWIITEDSVRSGTTLNTTGFWEFNSKFPNGLTTSNSHWRIFITTTRST